MLFPKIGKKINVSPFTPYIYHFTRGHNQQMKAIKNYKRTTYWKGEVKSFLFTENMIAYVQYPKYAKKNNIAIKT